MSGLREVTEQTMVEAHKAGAIYWRLNRVYYATPEAMASVARSCGWHGEDTTAWLAGFYGAKRRSEEL